MKHNQLTKCGTVFAAVLTAVFTLVSPAYAFKNDKALPSRQQSIVKIAAFTANGNLDKLFPAFNEGLNNGLSVNEVKEVLIQMYAYAGFPRSLNAVNTLSEVLKERHLQGVIDVVGPEPKTLPANKKKYDIGVENLGRMSGNMQAASNNPATYAQLVPTLEIFLKEHLFADIFGRGVLSDLDREIATVSALASLGNVNPQLQSHMNLSMTVGLTEEQGEELTAFIKKNVGRKEGKNAERVFKKVVENRKNNPGL